MNMFDSHINAAVKDYFTSADGETFAIGRGLGIILFIAGLLAPAAVAVFLMVTQEPPMSDWVSFLTALGIYIPALIGSVTLLIWGTNGTEPKAGAKRGEEQTPS